MNDNKVVMARGKANQDELRLFDQQTDAELNTSNNVSFE